MTVEEFENGYWYAVEVKAFALELGIPSVSTLRKDELEDLIKHFLRTGNIKISKRKQTSRLEVKDIEKGLSLDLGVVNYSDTKETKSFIRQEALKIVPQLPIKSGVLYRLNRWREEQLNLGKKTTYGDLVKKFIELSQTKGKFVPAPSGRYINFLADFLANETDVTRQMAIEAWHRLKKLDIPKDYQSWKKYKQGSKNEK